MYFFLLCMGKIVILLQVNGFGAGLCVIAKVLQCAVGFLIPNAPERQDYDFDKKNVVERLRLTEYLN